MSCGQRACAAVNPRVAAARGMVPGLLPGIAAGTDGTEDATELAPSSGLVSLPGVQYRKPVYGAALDLAA